MDSDNLDSYPHSSILYLTLRQRTSQSFTQHHLRHLLLLICISARSLRSCEVWSGWRRCAWTSQKEQNWILYLVVRVWLLALSLSSSSSVVHLAVYFAEMESHLPRYFHVALDVEQRSGSVGEAWRRIENGERSIGNSNYSDSDTARLWIPGWFLVLRELIRNL